jgi:hypothetical protein
MTLYAGSQPLNLDTTRPSGAAALPATPPEIATPALFPMSRLVLGVLPVAGAGEDVVIDARGPAERLQSGCL